MAKVKKAKTQEINTNTQTSSKGNSKINYYIAGAVGIVVIAGAAAIFSGGGGASNVPAGGDMTIQKDKITSTATFIPYRVGDKDMEVIAVKASDGTIRTAFNTCQVCFDSGRGYYVQEGNELVCQNCGNRFQVDQIEVVKGGCNPVPIFDQDTKEDATNIVIAEAYLKQNEGLFGKWKK